MADALAPSNRVIGFFFVGLAWARAEPVGPFEHRVYFAETNEPQKALVGRRYRPVRTILANAAELFCSALLRPDTIASRPPGESRCGVVHRRHELRHRLVDRCAHRDCSWKVFCLVFRASPSGSGGASGSRTGNGGRGSGYGGSWGVLISRWSGRPSFPGEAIYFCSSSIA
jgi:hypothetical protein